MCIIYGLNYLDSENHDANKREHYVLRHLTLDRNDVIIC